MRERERETQTLQETGESSYLDLACVGSEGPGLEDPLEQRVGESPLHTWSELWAAGRNCPQLCWYWEEQGEAPWITKSLC